MEDALCQLYTAYTGHAPAGIVLLTTGSGSNRRYFRMAGCPTLIGVAGESTDENRAFCYLAGHFRRRGLPVPQVVARSADERFYLQEDLGDVSLFDAIAHGRADGNFGEKEKKLLHDTIRWLPKLQTDGAKGLDFSRCYPQAAFDARSISWDLNYFKYCFLKATGTDFREDRLEDDFEQMKRVLSDDDEAAFMYRDFQSRNVMLKEGLPWFIDFQGGRRGPVYYDVASFLWQAKANFPTALREELLATYMEALRAYRRVDETAFRQRLRHFVLFRTLQVLGAYGFRGYYERKAHFLQSIPFALANLEQLLQTPYPDYPYLSEVLGRMIRRLRPTPKGHPRTLTVSVTSFAYPRGIPEDRSGHGGGFVFDCRAIHNPGRYDRYKTLSGKDEPVIRFLEEDGEITTFLQHAYALVDAAVRRYMERGFTHLCVCFGCTGGQHRSVYAAQHMAEHLHREFGVRVELSHREQGIAETLEGGEP